MRKKIMAIAAACLVGIAAYGIGHNHGMAENQEINDRALAESPMCWGDMLLENFVLDVVDESDFWYECDSTAFSDLAENSSEWYLAVCLEYARWEAKVN